MQSSLVGSEMCIRDSTKVNTDLVPDFLRLHHMFQFHGPIRYLNSPDFHTVDRPSFQIFDLILRKNLFIPHHFPDILNRTIFVIHIMRLYLISSIAYIFQTDFQPQRFHILHKLIHLVDLDLFLFTECIF